METNDRPRKKIQESGKAASRRKSAVSRGAPAGSLKGRPLADEGRTGREKPSLAAARRTSSDAEQSPSRRKDLPLPLERPDREDRREDRSLRLTLRVEGERITVVNAMEVDAPARELQPVRGSRFLEVRTGDQVLALEPLVDPGVAIGIPDPRDGADEFRGHREIELPSYEVAVRVPLEALESAGAPTPAKRRIEVNLYRATENLELDPSRTDSVREARRRLARVAASGPLAVDDVRKVSRSENRKPEPRQHS